MTCTESMMPCALIINTLADVLAKLLFEVVCIFLYIFLFHLTCVRKCLCFWPVPPADIARTCLITTTEHVDVYVLPRWSIS